MRNIDRGYLREKAVDSPVFRTMACSPVDIEDFTYAKHMLEFDMKVDES